MVESTAQQIESPTSEACWVLLERVIASVQLHRAPRLREFLSYVGRRSLKDGCTQVHEQEIGIEVFGRPEGYDTSVDNIVRANATELRKRIEAYFESEGLNETLVMEIPRGSYIPVFRNRPAKADLTQGPLVSVGVAAFESLATEGVESASPDFGRRRWMLPALIISGTIIVVLACTCIALWIQNRDLDRSFYAWRYSPSLSTFWSEFLGTHRDTDVIMSDAFIKLAEGRTGKPFTLDDYANGNYINQLLAQEKNPEVHSILTAVSSWRSSNENHLILARRFLTLDPLGKNIHLYYARDYTPELLKQDNAILLGSRVTNPWDSLFENRLNFSIRRDSEGFSEIVNRAPAAGEQAIYSRADPAGYCVVAYMPNPSDIGKVLLVEGTSVQATEACGDFLLSEDQLASFQKMLRVTQFPYFELLLKTSQVRDTSFSGTMLAYRVYPNQH
jgi:hypothetical protein